MLDLIDDPRWIRLIDARRTRDELGPIELVGAPKWNRAMDAWWAAFQPVAQDRALLARARQLVDLTSDIASLRFLYELLTPPVAEFELDVKGLLNDPRVDIDPGTIEWAFALYIAEHTLWGRDDPYETDQPGSGLARSLSRVGGAPTEVPGHLIPDDPFLLQVDLGQQLRDSLSEPKAKSFVKNSGLPRGGLLQLFHSTTGDSLTDPGVPGGGATVRYFSESDLRHRRTPDHTRECVVFPVHHAKLAVLPTFTWRPDADLDATAQKVIALQRAVDRHARGDEVSEEVSLQQAANPFRVSTQPPSRLLGVQHYDHPLEPYDAEQLTACLPLADSEDTHILLFTVASEFSLDSVFGDGGVLEVWMRRSDLAALRFDQVFSLIRSS